jgi:RHS repeat-associated protein
LSIDGQLVPSGDTLRFDYYIKDHLGNVRVVIDEKGDILQKTDYYPFGLEIDRNSPVQPQKSRNGINRYSFQGQERQIGSDYVQFKWRLHDPLTGRFLSVDPLSEKYAHNSTYAFSENKVIGHIELEGLEGVSFHEYMEQANSKPRFEMETPFTPAFGNANKAGVSGSVSIGLQAGIVDKQFGIGLGAFINLGSVEIGTLQIDAVDGSKGELIGENNQITIKQGGEIQLGVIGFETSTDREITNSGKNLALKQSTGVSIGPFKFSDEKVETYSQNKSGYVKTGENSFRTTTIAESKSIKALGGGAEMKAGVTIGGNYKFIDNRPWESRRDATNVIKSTQIR